MGCIVSKAKVLEPLAHLLKSSPTRYYGCVNCGHVGDFGVQRSRGLACQRCGYDLVTEYDEGEYVDATQRRSRDAALKRGELFDNLG